MKKLAAGLAGVLFATAFSTAALTGSDGITLRKVKAAFEDVALDLSDAIINRGYKIDHKAYIGKMLERTGPDVGSTKPIYKDAETVQFCSALLSREMMEADPDNIAFCPYVIFYYERSDEPGTVYVGYRELGEGTSDASKIALEKVRTLLDEIIGEVTGE